MSPTATAAPPTDHRAERLTAVHRDHGGALLRYLGGFTAAGPQHAEDLFQETMIRVWRRIDDLPADPDHARRWLFVVARNVGIDAVRRAHARPVQVDLLDNLAVPGGDGGTDTVVALDALRGALDALSAPHRRILAELYLEGRSLREAAARLGVPLGTAKSRAHYALHAVRKAVAGAS